MSSVFERKEEWATRWVQEADEMRWKSMVSFMIVHAGLSFRRNLGSGTFIFIWEEETTVHFGFGRFVLTWALDILGLQALPLKKKEKKVRCGNACTWRCIHVCGGAISFTVKGKHGVEVLRWLGG